MKKLTMIADSNENNSYSNSPSELYVDGEGNCWEETYSSRQDAEQFDGYDSLEQCQQNIGYFMEYGYWQVPGDEIKRRFCGLTKYGYFDECENA